MPAPARHPLPPAAAWPPRHQLLLAIFAGGALGGALRLLTAELLPHDPGSWPAATLLVNVLGAFVLGWAAAGLLATPDLDPRVRPFLATGLCGGLTTFSLLQVELLQLVDGGHPGVAISYAAASLLAGVLAVLAGQAIAGRTHPPAQDVSAGEAR